jgi:Asp-tRNA(Asn)/Glu-tRNA(Gln) amidotransferase A subunit family amidase
MFSRRQVLRLIPSLGIGSAVFGRALAQQAEGKSEITQQMIAEAKWVSGINLTSEQEESLSRQLNSLQKQLDELRQVALDPQDDIPATCIHTVAPIHSDAHPPDRTAQAAKVRNYQLPPLDSDKAIERPASDAEVAFLPVKHLARLLRQKQLTSLELTQIYLDRLKRFDPDLLCVVNLTENLALEQAKRADQELSSGRDRGPLHGIPWGAKDLISVEGYPTTWGIPVFRDRVLNQTATVAKRLEEAGAVLVAKLSLGAIAMGDKWFGGMTRNPWNVENGSSGSSAGSCCASSAGLVGFALGSETLGSILTPSRVCSAHGLRPTLGRVSRAGCMPLSWTMDKIGPIGRCVDDLALVLAAIEGPDGLDPTVSQQAFQWPAQPLDFAAVKVGIVPRDKPDPNLEVLQQMGCKLIEVEFPKNYPLGALTKIIDIEGAAVFQDLLQAGEVEGWNTWPKAFQTAHYISAIDYLRMQRVRRRLMLEFEQVFAHVDVLFNANDLMYTNFTGHPSISLPFAASGSEAKQPSSVVFTGKLFDEERLLAIAQEFERRLPMPLPLPPQFSNPSL